MKSLAQIFTLVALLALTGAAQAQTTLDFEALPNPSNGSFTNQGVSITEDGFTLTALQHNQYGFASIASDGANISLNYTGSVALFNNTIGGVTRLTQDNGNPFTLNSIDLANLFLQPVRPGGDSVDFTGDVQGGGMVTQSFTLAASNALQTFAFNASFTNLLSVSFTQDGLLNQFDNIVVNGGTPVPEPGSVALLVGAGIGGVTLRRRKK